MRIGAVQLTKRGLTRLGAALPELADPARLDERALLLAQRRQERLGVGAGTPPRRRLRADDAQHAVQETAEDHRRLNGGVERVLSKNSFAPAELMARVGKLLLEVKGQAGR